MWWNKLIVKGILVLEKETGERERERERERDEWSSALLSQHSQEVKKLLVCFARDKAGRGRKGVCAFQSG